MFAQRDGVALTPRKPSVGLRSLGDGPGSACLALRCQRGDDLVGTDMVEVPAMPTHAAKRRGLVQTNHQIDPAAQGWQRQHKTWVGQQMLRVPAVDLPAGDAGLFAKILLARAAGIAITAGPAQPTDLPRTRPCTSAPKALTWPTTSWPGTMGRPACGRTPSAKGRSVRHTPQAATLMRTCPGPGRGNRSGQPACKGWLGARNSIANQGLVMAKVPFQKR
jgi:hypothetical protein